MQSANANDVLKMAEHILEMAEPSYLTMKEEDREKIRNSMKQHISKGIELTNSVPDVSKHSDDDLKKLMRKLLPEADYDKIIGYVDQETYTMAIAKDEATVMREKEKFQDPISLKTKDGITVSSTVQIVSLVAECVFFVLGVIGFKVAVRRALMQRIIDEIMPVVRQPVFQRIVDEFLAAWATGGAWARAKAIFILVKETKTHGIFWKIVKLAFEEMTWYDKVITIASIAAIIAAELATEGIALIAKIALSVNDAYNITKKVYNLNELKTMNAGLNK